MAGSELRMKPCDIFQKRAEQYDSPPHSDFYRSIASRLVESIPAEQDGQVYSILEIGAGTGFATALLRERFPEADITALEPSAAMATRGEINCAGADWIIETLAEFSGGGYDLVVTSMSSHWLEPAEVEKMMRLAGGGILALALPVTGGPHLNGNRALLRLMREKNSVAGLRWPHALRRPETAVALLQQRFADVAFQPLSIRELFPDAATMAEALQIRCVLPALFGIDSPAAETALASIEGFNIGFSWQIGLFLARS